MIMADLIATGKVSVCQVQEQHDHAPRPPAVVWGQLGPGVLSDCPAANRSRHRSLSYPVTLSQRVERETSHSVEHEASVGAEFRSVT
jgi:hypothetical protein